MPVGIEHNQEEHNMDDMSNAVRSAIDEAHAAAGGVYNDVDRFTVQQSLVIARSLLGHLALDIAAMEAGLEAAAHGIDAMTELWKQES